MINYTYFMKKLLLIIAWMPLTLGTILVTLYLTGVEGRGYHLDKQSNIAYATVLGAYQSVIVAGDARPAIITRFLKRYSCPLMPYEHYAQAYVTAADTYNLDFRLLPAISMQESNCCFKIPEGSNNCWGYGIYGKKVVKFSSIEAGMQKVAETLARSYSQKGLLEPIEIMQKYTPQSQGSWALGVTYFMEQMR